MEDRDIKQNNKSEEGGVRDTVRVFKVALAP